MAKPYSEIVLTDISQIPSRPIYFADDLASRFYTTMSPSS